MSQSSPQSAFSILTVSKSGEVGQGGKAGLLRLFDSDYFNCWMALSYLWKYSRQEVGIQFKLVERLRQMPSADIEFILPQLCHLVVCSPDESAPLKHFLLDTCRHSLHPAIFTLWYLENFLADFRPTFARDARLYLRAARTLEEVQRGIFHKLQDPDQDQDQDRDQDQNQDEDPGERVGKDQLQSRSKDQLPNAQEASAERRAPAQLPGVAANMVGAGCLLLGVAVPALAERMRPLVASEAAKSTVSSPGLNVDADPSARQERAALHGGSPRLSVFAGAPSLEDLRSGNAFSLSEYIFRAAKQMHVHPPAFMMPHAHGQRPQSRPAAPPLRPLYYYPEMQFVTSLIDVSNRLTTVAKDGRLQALAAELALINHNLPASICLPLWCSGQPHHRILRICPSDAVVLNSAERVPFLVQVEVLERGGMSDGEFEECVRLSLEQDHLRPGTTSPPPSSRSASAEDAAISSPRLQSTCCGLPDSLESVPLEGEGRACDQDALPAAGGAGQAVDGPEEAEEIFMTDLTASSFTALSSTDLSERMRTAAIMLAQLMRQSTQPNCPAAKLADIAAIRDRIIREMEALEKNRLLDALQRNDDLRALDTPSFFDQKPLFDREDPSAAVFQESWSDKLARIKRTSPFGHIDGWQLFSVIVKSGADMRQEQLACQIICEMTRIWNDAGLPLWTYCYRVLVASANGGLIETVPNAISIHSIKKNAYMKNKGVPGYTFNLRNHFIKTFGSPDSQPFQEARSRFIQSLAAYSLATYLLQVKDRHDGNILLDSEGHLIHIDFGFMLSNAPGYVGFESAPFKLSQEYIELLGGLHSGEFEKFKSLMFHAFLELRKHADRILLLVEVMQKESKLPCFYAGESAVSLLRHRFNLSLTEAQLRQVVDRLVISSAFNVFTKLYDTYQYYSNGIL